MANTAPNLDDVRRILREQLPSPAYHAVLFGSRARHRARPGSDWDVGLIGPAPLPGAVVQRIREALEDLRTLHTFDVVDLVATPDAFRAEALANAEPLV